MDDNIRKQKSLNKKKTVNKLGEQQKKNRKPP